MTTKSEIYTVSNKRKLLFAFTYRHWKIECTDKLSLALFIYPRHFPACASKSHCMMRRHTHAVTKKDSTHSSLPLTTLFKRNFLHPCNERVVMFVSHGNDASLSSSCSAVSLFCLHTVQHTYLAYQQRMLLVES